MYMYVCLHYHVSISRFNYSYAYLPRTGRQTAHFINPFDEFDELCFICRQFREKGYVREE